MKTSKNTKKLPKLSSQNLLLPKTFINDTNDQRITKILTKHGWSQLAPNALTSQLKWSWKATHNSVEAMHHQQFYNHFKNSEEMTTKLGLMNSFRKNIMIDEKGCSYTSYYPRSYNLHTQMEEVIEDFLRTGILNLLKKIIAYLQIYFPKQYEHLKKSQKKIPTQSTHKYLSKLLQNKKIFTRKKKTMGSPEDRKFLIDERNYIRLLVYLENLTSIESHYELSREEKMELLEYGRNEQFGEEKKEDSNQRNSQISVNSYKQKYTLQSPSTKSLLLLLLYYKLCSKSNTFYPDGFSNIWIIKSNHSSRGRGITLVDTLEQIQRNNNGMKIIQKYIENIWILQEKQLLTNHIFMKNKDRFGEIIKIVNRKFDIRLWVLVKSCSPLVVYVYDEGYLRITAEDYQLDELKKHKVHLTNYTVNWHKKSHNKKQQSYILLSFFLEFIEQVYGKSASLLKNKINDLIINTIKSVELSGGKGCFQLFGFDVLLDGKLDPWLLECNMSPACSQRGELSQIYKDMISGLLSLQGLIENSQNDWKLLYKEQPQQASIRNSFLSSSSKNTKYTDFFTNTSNNFFTENQQKTKLKIIGKEANKKKLFSLQAYHYTLESIIKIQRFIRYKFNFNLTKTISLKTIQTDSILSETNKIPNEKLKQRERIEILIKEKNRINRKESQYKIKKFGGFKLKHKE